jgi:hypothetical protein
VSAPNKRDWDHETLVHHHRSRPVAAVAASQAHAAGDFNVSCSQMQFFVGDTGHAEYVTSTDVSRNGTYWTIIHRMSSGKTYSRGVQYGVSDISRSNFDEWGGVRVGHPNIVMHGLIGVDRGRILYKEWVYDTNLRGNPGDIGKIVGQTVQDWLILCASLRSS